MTPRIRLLIVLFAFTRLVLNSAYRMIYPFISAFSRGLGVDLPTIAIMLSARSFVGALGPLLAPIADRSGRKTNMLLGLGIFIVSAAAVAVWPGYTTFFAAIVLGTLGMYIYLPAIQAFLGDQVPYEQRGRAIAITELSWSLAGLIGVPLIGLLIAAQGWAAGFPILAGCGLLAFILLVRLVPAVPAPGAQADNGFWHSLRLVFSHPTALTGLTMSLMMTAGNEMISMIFGVWLEDTFALKIAALGAASAVIGAAELGGETLTGVLVDRVGKKRSVQIGLAVCSLFALALPLLEGQVWLAFAGLFFYYLAFEYALVSSLPLMTEMLPAARATLMAANVAAFSIGRGIADLLSPQLYGWGIAACAAASIGFNLLALLALSRVKLK